MGHKANQATKQRVRAQVAESSPFEAAVGEALELFRAQSSAPVFGDARDEKLNAAMYFAEATRAAGSGCTEARLRELAQRLNNMHPDGRVWCDLLRAGARRVIRATKVSDGAALSPPTTGLHTLLGGPPGDVTAVGMELLGLSMQPPATPLELIALEVLEAVEQCPEVFGAIDRPLHEHLAVEAERAARWAEALEAIPEACSMSDLARHAAGGDRWVLSFLWGGDDTGISISDPAALIARLAAH